MNWFLFFAPVLAVWVVGVAIMRKVDKKYPTNGKDIDRALNNRDRTLNNRK